MRLISRLLSIFLIIAFQNSNAQTSCLSTGLNGTVVNLPCNVSCSPFSFKVPHLKSTSDYKVVDIAYTPFPFIVNPPAGVGSEAISTYVDDKFSELYNLPFPVCFYDSTFTQFVIGSNGVITFDITNANCNNAWKLENSAAQPIPFLGTSTCSDGTGPKYPKYSIMGPYHDIDPSVTSSTPNRKIEWRYEGTAPCRKLVVSFFEIALFGDWNSLCTAQMVVHESTGLIDIFLREKKLDSDGSPWNSNLAILGVQKDGTTAVAAPGKNGTVWADTAKGYRFVPSGPVSRFVRSELTTLSGTILATTGITSGADTATTVPGLLDINFPSQCPTAASTPYIVKTYYTSCSSGSTLIEVSDTVTINKTTSLNATAAQTPSACGPNGSITVTIPPGAGTLPYSLVLDGGSPVSTSSQTQTFTGLIAGPHTIVVTTAGGCSQTLNVTVGTSGTLTVNHTSSNPICYGAQNGSVTLSPVNGVAPFQYNINNGLYQSNATFSNLPAGNYVFGIKDNSGCVLVNYSVTLAQGPLLTAGYVSSPPSCNGANNGSLTINPTSGLPPYTYSINAGLPQSSNVFTNIPTGTYFIAVTDAQGCTSGNFSVAVGPGGALTATATATGTSCAGANNGSIAITPTSGGGPYQYSLNGTTFLAGTSITNLAAGSYSVWVKDNAGCVSAPIPVTVTQGNALLATATSTVASCAGVNNGTITVTPTNGGSPYTYKLDGGSPQSGNVFTNVSAGSHNVVVTDNAGCVSSPIQITVGVGAAITGTTATAATSCNGASNGSVTITPTSGSTPFQYSVDNGAFQSSNIFNGLSSGAHAVVIRDAAGCSSSPINFTVAAGGPLTATATPIATSCSGATDGTINVVPGNGNAPYQYQLDGGAFQSSSSFTGVTPGPHLIVVKDGAGCTSAAIPVTVVAGAQLTASVATTPVICNGELNGTITVTNNNGAGPFQYSLDGTNFQTSNTFTGLGNGSYTITYKNNSGCQNTIQATITQPAPLTISPSEQAALCNGQNNGSIFVAATGGTTPYRYSIDGTNYQTSNNFTVAAGTYTVYVKDAKNCIKSQAVTITQPQVLSASAVSVASSCAGNDGTITISGNGGSGNYQYSINGTSFQASNLFTAAPGNYTVTVKDLNGCTATSATIVGLNNNLFVVPMTDQTICEGLGVKLMPNTNATQFSWSPATGLSSSTAAQPTASPTATTDYYLTAKLGICSSKDTVRVNVNPAPIANAGPDGNICFGQTFQLQGSGGVQYQWTPSTYLSSTSVDNPVVTPNETIQYSLNVTDALGCKSLQPDGVVVNVVPPIVIQISNDTIVAMGDVLQLHASSVATDYLWSPAFGLDDPYSPDPLATVSGDITYTVLASTSAGCKGEAKVTLKVYEGPEIYVPTAFTPNGDGKNDVFKPFPVGIKYYTYLRVFNRWGQLIFSTTSFNQGWDGTINGKLQPTGTYVWMVEGVTKNDKKLTKQGTVTLIR